jgi:hypothetical protein
MGTGPAPYTTGGPDVNARLMVSLVAAVSSLHGEPFVLAGLA